MVEPKSRCDTLVSLRDHFESQCQAHQRATDLARELMEARLTAAEINLERRLDGLNHLRETVLTKGEYQAGHSQLTAEVRSVTARIDEKVANLMEWKAEQKGKASVSSVYLSVAISVIGLLVAVIALAHELFGR